MGYNDSGARKILIDIETAPIADAADYLEDPTPPSNYGPDAAAKWVVKAKAEALAKAALDPDLCRIVAIGLLEAPGVPQDASGDVWLCRDETEERDALTAFWARVKGSQFVGFNQVQFDLPVLLRRSLYLNVPAPSISLDKYRHGQLDVMQILALNGALKYRSLSFYLKRFSLPATDGKGSEVPALVAAGDWAAVESHLRADLLATASLAQRVGVL